MQAEMAMQGGSEVDEEIPDGSHGSQKDQQSSRRQLSQKSGGVTFSQADSKREDVRKKLKDRAEKESSLLWQSPYVDVFKHFSVLPGDWKLNQKRGEVDEYFAREIGRRAYVIEGSITANNYIQIPNQFGPVKSLGLTGRYIYFQVKSPRHGQPFNYGVDLNMAEMSHCLRLSLSNLFKNFGTANGFVIQMPLELKNNCWTIVAVDIIDTLKRSNILPPTYLLDGSFSVRSITVCANTHIRGIFTSDSLYDFVTLPADMRFKFPFDLSQWMEYFDWQSLPSDWKRAKVNLATGEKVPGDENLNLLNMIEKGPVVPAKAQRSKEDMRDQMRQEIDGLLQRTYIKIDDDDSVRETASEIRRKKYDDMQKQLSAQFAGGAGATAGMADPMSHGMIRGDEIADQGPQFGAMSRQRGGTGRSNDYRSGQFSGHDLTRSHKLNVDPIMELKHIIGYQPDMCFDLRWSKQEGENVVLFSSGGTMIAMDAESNKQKRFFFGHTAPICCFDLNSQGNLIASGQDGKDGKYAIFRLWDYETARCITFTDVPVHILNCMSFSQDGRYLVTAGVDIFKVETKNDVKVEHKRELIIIWDIARVSRGEKPEIVAKQTSEFNIKQIKFDPHDPTHLASCGRENIRFWKIRHTGNIRGKSVVLEHHARDTVFTSLDFEFSFRGSARLDIEGPKRLFVGSRHGTVFQVDYGKEELKETYKTNDKAITSISVNDQFCVVGSEDSYLRVWPLDFQEFFMEAQHEGPVSAVDISNDGLKIVCGTLYGSIGILDKSNYNYKPLLRSHTDEILAIDFHKLKMNIITVSKDKTIRLWDIIYLEQVYEFTSALDQPLSVAAHPFKPTFACGFQSGKLRIFDIDTTEVTDEFAQFKKPLKALSYDNSGKFLITCSEDGAISIHNAARQHLPIRMITLEMPPEFVHIAFSRRISSEPNDLKQKFGAMGEYGNSVSLYDTESFLVQHQIMVNTIVKSFQFANNNKDLLIVTKDCRIRFYNLNTYEGHFLREVAHCHRGSIRDIDVSVNSGYMLTAGEDKMVKIWDYEAQKTTPYYFQSFIGHTYPLKAIIFNPRNNSQIISVGERDGIYVWDFYGDVGGDYHVEKPREEDLITPRAEVVIQPQSMLEQIRTQNKASKQFRNQMADDSFILPQTVAFELAQNQMGSQDEFFPSPDRVDIVRADRKLTYNHYCNLHKRVDIDIDSSGFISNLSIVDTRHQLLEHKLINGYDGFGGVHDNLFWNVRDGLTYFTLNNKLIVEKTKTREQTVYADSSVQLSCMAVSKDMKMIAVAEGSQSPQGTLLIFLYDVEKNKKLFHLSGQQKGIQSMAFFESRYLITAGTQGDNSVAIWNLNSRQVEKSALVGHYAMNQVKVDPCVGSQFIQFATVGNNASFTVWRYDTESQELALYDVKAALPTWSDVHFLCVSFTDFVQAPLSNTSEGPSQTNYAVIGTSDGTLVPFDLTSQKYTELGMISKLTKGEVGVVNIAHDYIVVGCSDGTVAQYRMLGVHVTVQDMDTVIKHSVDSAVMAISMDDVNEQGLIGTEAGNIYYINFLEAGPIRLVSSNNMNQDAITYLKFDFANPRIFAASCGQRTEQLKLSTGENCDEVMNFRSNFEEYGYVVFVIGHPQHQKRGNQKGALSKKQIRLIGFSNGYIKVAFFESLTIKHVFRVPLNREAGEVLTCGMFSQNQKNFAFGTNHGTLYFGNITQGKRGIDANYARIGNVGKCNSFDTVQAENANTTAAMLKRHTKNMNSDIINDNDSLDIEHMDSVLEFNDVIGISSIHFPYQDPISTILIAFDDGTIRLWQSQQNPNLIQVIKLQSGTQGPAHFDIFDMGYQQFDIVDNFDIFQNPDDLEEVSEDERMKIKALYKNKSYPSCQARFFPGNAFNLPPADLYLCWVDALQFLYIRNFQRSEIIKRIPLNANPSCLTMVSFSRLSKRISEEAAISDVIGTQHKGTYLLSIGTKCGKVVIYRVTTQAPFTFNKLYTTRAGLSFGPITAIDIQTSPTPEINVEGDLIIAGSESGEIHVLELMKRLNEES